MLWRLDRFLISVKAQSKGPTYSQAEKKTPPPANADTSFDADSKKSENFKPEEESSAWTDDVDSKKSEKAQDKDSANEPFFNSENSDAEMAEVLGLEKIRQPISRKSSRLTGGQLPSITRIKSPLSVRKFEK